MSGGPAPYEHLLTPVDEARDGRWYIILHRRVDSATTGFVDQFCTPSADGRGLHYYDRPSPLAGGLPRDAVDARAKAQELQDHYGPDGFTVWLMRHELRPWRGWLP